MNPSELQKRRAAAGRAIRSLNFVSGFFRAICGSLSRNVNGASVRPCRSTLRTYCTVVLRWTASSIWRTDAQQHHKVLANHQQDLFSAHKMNGKMIAEEKQVENELLVAARDLQGLQRLRQVGLLTPSRTSSTSVETSAADDDETLVSYWTQSSNGDDDDDTNEAPLQFDAHGRVTLLHLGGKRLHRGLDQETIISSSGMAHFSALQTLHLGGTDLPAPDTVRVLAAVAGTLTNLYLGGNGLGNDGVALLASWMAEFCNNTTTRLPLVKLDLRYNNITGDSGLTALCQTGLPHCPKLAILHLEGNRIGDEGCAALANCCMRSGRQRTDHVDDISTPTTTATTTTTPSGDCRLEQLYLGANGIGPVGAAHLAKVLRSENSRLTKLYLEGNDMGDAGAAAWSQALEDTVHDTKNKSSVLQHLFVDNNNIGKEASQRLTRALNRATVVPNGLED